MDGFFGGMMDPQWARDLRDASARFGRKFFMKQMTGKTPIPPDLMVRQRPAALNSKQVGSKGMGRVSEETGE